MAYIVLCLFLAEPSFGQIYVILAFPGHTHLIFESREMADIHIILSWFYRHDVSVMGTYACGNPKKSVL